MRVVSGWNFDWDDNIFYMPTNVVLYNRESGEERAISTAEFATVRQHLGEESTEWALYETRGGPGETFRYFRDSTDGRNYFREDIDKAVGSNDPSWIGPSWEAFLFALRKPQTAENVTIITARGHSPIDMLDGLRFLRARGYVRHLPPEENLFPVSHPSLAGDAKDPAPVKAEVMVKILDGIEKIPVDPGIPRVLNRDGDRTEQIHLWGFSDDDWGNFSKARERLTAEVANGRWRNIKITVFFTGAHDLEHEARAEVITSKGTLRAQQEKEKFEGEVTTLGASPVKREPATELIRRPKRLWEDEMFRSLMGKS